MCQFISVQMEEEESQFFRIRNANNVWAASAMTCFYRAREEARAVQSGQSVEALQKSCNTSNNHDYLHGEDGEVAKSTNHNFAIRRSPPCPPISGTCTDANGRRQRRRGIVPPLMHVQHSSMCPSVDAGGEAARPTRFSAFLQAHRGDLDMEVSTCR